jgi:hypothetical protein
MVLSDEQTQGLLNDFHRQVKDYVINIIDSGRSRYSTNSYGPGMQY